MSTMTSVAGAVAGAALVAGAGLMYVLDPVAGSRRRTLARDQLGHARRRVTEATENRLELRADPAELPGVQSPIPDLPRDPRLDLTRRRWSPSERAEGVALGGGLLLDGVRRGGLSGATLGIAGLLVLFGALTNKPLAERFTRRERRAIGADRLSDSAPGRCALPSRQITARVRSTEARAGGGEQ